jgi:hypothetical protein
MRATVQDLHDRVVVLSPADQLRLAAGLLEGGVYNVAEVIVRKVADELAALQILGPSGRNRNGHRLRRQAPPPITRL